MSDGADCIYVALHKVNGVLELWITGVLHIFELQKKVQQGFHYSITPQLHYSSNLRILCQPASGILVPSTRQTS